MKKYHKSAIFRKISNGIFMGFILMYLFNSLMIAQEHSSIDNARKLAYQGDFESAEEIFSRIIAIESQNMEAVIGRAYVRSWQGKYSLAKGDFLVILKNEPDNIGALIGLGYNYAWSKDYDNARQIFKSALASDDNNIEAKKGLAFVEFWQGNNKDAIRQFSTLQDESPDDPEISTTLGQAYQKGGNPSSARSAYRMALSLDPGYNAAILGLNELDAFPPLLDLEVWGGYTEVSQANGAGFRSAELGYRPNYNARVWLRLDNSLSLDSPALLRANINSLTYSVGGFYKYGSNLTIVRIGYRNIQEGNSQILYSAEQIFFPGSFTNIKIGALLIDNKDRSQDYTLYTGVGKSVHPKVYVEPVFFYARIGETKDTEWRLILNGEYKLSPSLFFGGSFGVGNINTSIEGISGNIYAGHLSLSKGIGNSHRVYLLYRYESLPVQSLSLFSLGIKLSLKRN